MDEHVDEVEKQGKNYVESEKRKATSLFMKCPWFPPVCLLFFLTFLLNCIIAINLSAVSMYWS